MPHKCKVELFIQGRGKDQNIKMNATMEKCRLAGQVKRTIQIVKTEDSQCMQILHMTPCAASSGPFWNNKEHMYIYTSG